MSEAINRYFTAKAYYQSTFMIFRSPDRDDEARKTTTLLPMSLLMGFALELYFKAWLIESSRTSGEVRKYGHRLGQLYQEVKKEGLPATPAIDDLVNAFEKGHEDFTYRYIEDGNDVNSINWEVALSVLDHLDNLVDEKVGASASHGLTPGRYR